MVHRDGSEDHQRLHDSGILVDCPVSPTSQRSPTSAPPVHRGSGAIWRAQRILNLEGESLLSLSALYILRELLKIISEIERDQGAFSSAASPLFRHMKTGTSEQDELPFRPCHYFDFISGASFGGISAVMLGIMRLTIDETIERCQRILIAIDPSVSKTPVSFVSWDRKSKNSDTLKQNLSCELESHDNLTDIHLGKSDDLNVPRTHFKAESVTMRADEQMCKTVVFTTQESRKGGYQRPFVFRSYHLLHRSARARNPDHDTTDVNLVDACRASLSTPSTFDSVRIDKLGKFRAASVSRINPAIEAYNEVRENYDADVKCLLSIGVDSTHSRPFDISSARKRLEQVDEQLSIEANFHGFQARRFADIGLPGAVASQSLRDAINTTRERAADYCKDPSTLKHMHSWAGRLVKYRRLRAETIRWSEYAGFEVSYPEEREGAHVFPRPASIQ